MSKTKFIKNGYYKLHKDGKTYRFVKRTGSVGTFNPVGVSGRLLKHRNVMGKLVPKVNIISLENKWTKVSKPAYK